MKKNTYLHDITDTFGDKTTSKDAVKIAKKIKSSQKKAFPSIEFKQHLGDRLSNIHVLKIEDDTEPRFSLLQLFGGFASFIFIAGGLLTFYQMSDLPLSEVSQGDNTLIIPEISQSMRVIDTQLQDTRIEEEAPSMMKSMSISEENMNDAESNFAPQDMQNINSQELCELYQGGYNSETQTCILPNGIECQNYDEDGINQCFQGDDSIAR